MVDVFREGVEVIVYFVVRFDFLTLTDNGYALLSAAMYHSGGGRNGGGTDGEARGVRSGRSAGAAVCLPPANIWRGVRAWARVNLNRRDYARFASLEILSLGVAVRPRLIRRCRQRARRCTGCRRCCCMEMLVIYIIPA